MGKCENKNLGRRRLRLLQGCLLALLVIMAALWLPAERTGGAVADTTRLKLTQTKPEEGFFLIPGAQILQDVAVEVDSSSASDYVFVQIREVNNENDYLTYSVAEGWQQVCTPEGTALPGVYYRSHERNAAASWPVLAGQQVLVNPETVTWPVLAQLTADATGESWPRLAYSAYGITLEDADAGLSVYDCWCLIDQSRWTVEYEQEDGASVGAALAVPEGLSFSAYDVTLQDANGNHMQPVTSLQVKLPVAQGADAAIILHELTSSAAIMNAIEAGKAVGLMTGTEMTIVEEISATVEDGYAVFTASAFSPYYVVSGSGTTLENWWETTQVERYNFDSEVYGLDKDETGAREFVVEPNTTFYIYLEGDVTVGGVSKKGPVEGTWAVTGQSDNLNNHIMLTTAGDGLGRVVSVSADAVDNDQLTFTADGWTVTIKVMQDVVAATYNNANYPVYIGITLDGSTISIGNEPRVSGYDNNAWVYVTGMSGSTVTVNGFSGAYEQYKTVKPLAGSVGADYLTEAIKTVTMLDSTDSKHVKGIIDNTLDVSANGAIDIQPYIRSINWDDIKMALLSDSSIASQLKATDGVAVSSSNEDNYVLQPYVVKIQTGNFVGWHINACFVPLTSSDGWVYFDENLDESLGQEVEFLNVPARRPWNGGQGTTASMYYVNPALPGSNYVKVSVSEYVTLTNGQKLRFMGWNTKPNGTGDMYSGEGGTFDSPNNSGNGIEEDNLVANGTLYAYWDSTLDRLEIHKDLIIDENQTTKPSKTDFKFKIEITLPTAMTEIDTSMQIIYEEFYVANDSLVPNTTKSEKLSEGKRTYTFEVDFTEDQYGVIYAPKGSTYTVTETLPSGTDYTLISAQNTEGTIEGVGEGSIVRFVNGWKNTTGLLRVSKKVELAEGQNIENWDTTKFPFTIELTAPAGVDNPTYTYQLYDRQNKPYGDPITTENHTITLELAHNESVVFTGIKEDTGYKVTETVAADSLLQPENPEISGAIKANETQEAVFVNRSVETDGLLTITKAFKDCSPEDGESFVFIVRDADNAVVAEVVIYGEGSKTLKVPYGEYTVTEENAWSWRYTASVRPAQPVTVDSNNNPIVTFTNTKSKPNWLDASAGVINVFGTTPSATPKEGEQ